MERDDGLPFRFMDFVIYDGEKLLLGGEIKSEKEIYGSASSWFNYHVKNTGRIRPEDTHKGIGELSVRAKGFVATIDGQMRGYAEDNGLKSIWFIDRRGYFSDELKKALEFL